MHKEKCCEFACRLNCILSSDIQKTTAIQHVRDLSLTIRWSNTKQTNKHAQLSCFKSILGPTDRICTFEKKDERKKIK